ncbi:MAG: 16S rRNA (guanine(966)-N(2))-methyltransferase RsmD [Aureispira sp.]
MRIVSGFLKGRRFEMPSSKWKTRPTTDYAKESLFNILTHRIELDGLHVLDLYAGTGNMGYEFASRGASRVLSVERYGACVRYIQGNIKGFKLEDCMTTRKQDSVQYVRQSQDQFDVIFADPPYEDAKYPILVNLILEGALLKAEGLLIVEHDFRQNFANHSNFVELRQYGQSYFSFFAHQAS